MTNWVSHYISNILFVIYYAFYVVEESILKESLSGFPVTSISCIIALLIILPLSSSIQLLALCWLDIDIPTNSDMLIDIILYLGLSWTIYCYYRPISERIERKIQRDSRVTKVAYGLLAVVLICLSIYSCSCLTDIYINAIQSKNNIH